jgi:predicted AAA+ superfamily ATPase
MRRSGKTYFIYQDMLLRLNQGNSSSRILYLNFEDDRLLPLDATKLASMLEVFYTFHPENHDAICYFYLNEIQHVPDWPSAFILEHTIW